MSLQEAQLQKRSKELDAREEFIDAKLKELDEAPLTFKVYEGRIKGFEQRLVHLKKEIEEATEGKNFQVEALTITIADLGLEKAILKKTIKDIQNKADANLAVSNDQLTVTEKRLQEVNKEIISRENYSKDQEKQIEEALSIGNDQLLSLNSLVAGLKIQKNSLESTIIELKSDIDSITIEKNTTISEHEARITALASKNQVLENIKAQLEKDIASSQEKLRKVKKSVNEKMVILKEKEQSVLTKRDVSILEQEKAVRAQRRLSGVESLYT